MGVAFGKFLGVFFPSISSSNWILHLWKVPPIPIGPMVLGNMDVGLNTQNLVAVLVVIFLSGAERLRRAAGRGGTERLHLRQDCGAAGTGSCWDCSSGATRRRSRRTSARTSGTTLDSERCIRCKSAWADRSRWWARSPSLRSPRWARCSRPTRGTTSRSPPGEVRNPQRNLPLSLAIGTGVVIFLYVMANVVYLSVLPLVGDPNGTTILAARHSVRVRRPRGDGGDAADLRLARAPRSWRS